MIGVMAIIPIIYYDASSLLRSWASCKARAEEWFKAIGQVRVKISCLLICKDLNEIETLLFTECQISILFKIIAISRFAIGRIPHICEQM